MTPPDTDLRTQRRKHRPALYGIAFVVFFALLTLILRAVVATDPDDTMLGPDPGPVLRAPAEGEAQTSPPDAPREPEED